MSPDQLLPQVYDELRKLAAAKMRNEADGHTLDATALVNEAFIRLCGWAEPSVTDRSHFFAVSARLMRNILVDRARAQWQAWLDALTVPAS